MNPMLLIMLYTHRPGPWKHPKPLQNHPKPPQNKFKPSLNTFMIPQIKYFSDATPRKVIKDNPKPLQKYPQTSSLIPQTTLNHNQTTLNTHKLTQKDPRYVQHTKVACIHVLWVLYGLFYANHMLCVYPYWPHIRLI